MPDKPVWQNTSAVSWLGIGKGGTWLRRTQLAETAARHMRRLRIQGGPHDITATLSGGNQQKVSVAKWLDIEPWLVILDDPTRGVDVGARAEMHDVISAFAEENKPVLLASTDLLELVDLCDRVLVFRRGRLVDEVTRPQLSERALSVAMNADFILTE
jgi:ABC-type sugar transport system ATPase subunit